MVATSTKNGSEFAKTLRLSITGECNLNCFYCKPLGYTKDLFQPRSLIQPSDVSKLVKIVGELGVNRVLLSGGEPLLRKDAPNFVKAAYAHKGISEVRLVTNGTHLKAYSDLLRKMGLKKVDINFDSLDFRKYHRITGEDKLYRVLDGIEKVEKLNFSDIRLNILLLSGINENELIDFAMMTKDRKLYIRFIEYRPKFSVGDVYVDRPGMPAFQAMRAIDNFQKLTARQDFEEDSAITRFSFSNGTGSLSFLSQKEIEAEDAVPQILFNADGVLSNELVPQRAVPILEELRRDAKEDRLHRLIEKIIQLRPQPEKKKSSRDAVLASKASRSTRSRHSSARA